MTCSGRLYELPKLAPPHQRVRWFGLAVPAISDARGVGRTARRSQSEELEGAVRCSSGDGRQLLAQPTFEDAYGSAWVERVGPAPREEEGGGHGPTLDDEVSYLLPYSDSIGRDGGTGDKPEPEGRDEPTNSGYSPAEWWGEYLPAVRRWEFLSGRQAPAPTELGPRGGRRLTAKFAEWMMGLPDGWVTDVPDLAPPKKDPRSKQLKAIGNGVVPQQAHAAYSHLLSLVEGTKNL